MRYEKSTLIEPCPKCGSYGCTIGYENGSNVVATIICDGCGEDLR